MSIYTDAEQAGAADLMHRLMSGGPPTDFTITTIAEIVAATEAYAGWIADALACGKPAKWVALQAEAAARYIAAAAKQLVAEAQMHADLALAAAAGPEYAAAQAAEVTR